MALLGNGERTVLHGSRLATLSPERFPATPPTRSWFGGDSGVTRKVVVELGAFNQMKVLLDGFRDFIVEREKKKSFKNLSVRSQLLVKLAWGERYYEEKSMMDTNWWIHAVLDFIVGMTDSYLNEVSKQIVGGVV